MTISAVPHRPLLGSGDDIFGVQTTGYTMQGGVTTWTQTQQDVLSSRSLQVTIKTNLLAELKHQAPN